MPGEKRKSETRNGKKFGGVLEYARHRKVSKSTVSDALKQERIKAGSDGMIDFEKADRDWANNTNVRPHTADQDGAGETGEPQSYAKSRAAREQWAAKQAKLDYELKSGKLVPVVEVSAKWSEICGAIRNAVEGIPSKLAQSVHAARDPREAHDIIAAECRAVLRQLSDEIKATAEQ
jgi:phage terminase Nu1 subunit (DNA packaging protein)